MHTFMHVLGMPGDTLGMSGDQVGMNGDEGGGGWWGTKKEQIFMEDLLKTNGLFTELEQNSRGNGRFSCKSVFVSGHALSGTDILVCREMGL